MLSGSFSVVRKTTFDYHSGLDLMKEEQKKEKKGIVVRFSKLNQTQFVFCVSSLMQNQMKFFPFFRRASSSISDLIDSLIKLSLNSSKWEMIKY
jgi:hypothetical protein